MSRMAGSATKPHLTTSARPLTTAASAAGWMRPTLRASAGSSAGSLPRRSRPTTTSYGAAVATEITVGSAMEQPLDLVRDGLDVAVIGVDDHCRDLLVQRAPRIH